MGDENIQQCSHQHKHWCAFLHKAELYITFRNFLSFRSLVSTISIGLQIKQQVTGPTESGCTNSFTSVLSLKLHFFMVLTELDHCITGACHRAEPTQASMQCGVCFIHVVPGALRASEQCAQGQ